MNSFDAFQLTGTLIQVNAAPGLQADSTSAIAGAPHDSQPLPLKLRKLLDPRVPKGAMPRVKNWQTRLMTINIGGGVRDYNQRAEVLQRRTR